MTPSRRSFGLMDATPVLFAGPNAADADHGKLDLAKRLESSGMSRDEIWKATGWFNDNGRWSFESSSPEPPAYRRPQLTKDRASVPLSSVSDDPAFAASYPALAETKVTQNRGLIGPGEAAVYLPKTGRPESMIALDSKDAASPRGNYYLQHEKQHAVDDYEGSLVPSMAAETKLPWVQKNSEKRAVNGAYRDLYMTPEQRQGMPPWETETTALKSMHPISAKDIAPSQGAAVSGGAPVKRLGTARGRGGLLDTLDGVGASQGGGGMRTPGYGDRDAMPAEILASARGGGLLDQMPPPSPGMGRGGAETPPMQTIMRALEQARSPVEAESILKELSQDMGDEGLMMIDLAAKKFGLRTPWNRDFSKPPSEMGGLIGPSGRPRPLQRMD